MVSKQFGAGRRLVYSEVHTDSQGVALPRSVFLAVIAVCAVMQLAAQQPPHPSPLEELLHPRSHANPAPANTPRTPNIQVDATNLGSPLLLDKGWRVGITANPKAADSDFDDSAWPIRDAQESFAEVPDQDHPAGATNWNSSALRPKSHQRPNVWFRQHLRLAPNHGPVFLLIELPPAESNSSGEGSLSVDLYANGRLIQPEGPHGDAIERYQQISRIYDLQLPASETSLTLAVRSPLFPTYTSFFANRKVRLGNREDLDRLLELWTNRALFERLPKLVNSILLAVLTLFLVTLYFTQKGHIEYLWLALYELLQVPLGFIQLAGNSAWLDRLWFLALVSQLTALSAYFYFEFLVSFLALRRHWSIRSLRYTAPLLACLLPDLLIFFDPHGPLVGIVKWVILAGSLLWLLGWLFFVFITLTRATLRRNFEAGLLLIPLVLSLIASVEGLLTAGMSDLSGRPFHSPLTFFAGPIPVHIGSIADFTSIFVIVLIIFVRFLRVQREQEHASSELAAARSVQELMIPQEKLVTPGFEVESIYNPANEVGGDFYHLQPSEDGGLLVVIGDVAGKGLKAAMNVSMLMGALRSSPERSPSKILAFLNRVLVGSESFTTCLASWFSPNGELVLASAGHLPPFLNSQEVAMPGGLPLGVLPEVNYEELRIYLHPGDRILLMSDGVVEARQPSGELFGFDRVHNLSNQSAFYIADAARDFGQEDDITVLTVRRLAEVAAA